MAEETLSESSAFKYQVFLSFRGPDTRQAFTDTLFHSLRDAGVRVFRDNNDLRLGHEIGEDLMQAIADSLIYIPIFSKTYAESKWCLRELVAMVEAARNSKDKEIIPIFCGVTTDDVKRENCLYDLALTAQREDRQTVQQWKEALSRVCKIKGWELKDEGHAAFCKSIVREISVKLKVKHKQVTDCLVGMDDQVKDLIDLLDMESDGVKFVGIHGMGGIGKTTLAKVIFNRLSASFDSCSFVSDVREKSDSKGLVYIQKQMLKDLGGSIEIDDEDDGINNIIAVSRMKKVLIVLDDVSRKKQIEKLAGASNWFGARSKIIVTTRDKRNFETKGSDIKPFEKEELDDEQALQLFSLHTFAKNTPPNDYISLSKEVISFTGRLPLAIEIIGSLLRVREEEFWRNKIEELKTIPLEDVQEKLRISYNSLDSREKEIFLDISCLFDGEDTTNPIYMWDACGFFPKAKVDVLVVTSLIKLKDGKFWMHDQVKDLGREIVRTENMEYPKKRSRVWEESEALRILKCLKKGRGKLKAIRLHDLFSDKQYTFTSEDLTGLENIRFLELPSCARIIGDLRDSFPNLRWFRLWNCESVMKVANFRMKSLVILELTGSDVSECWDGWNQIKMMDNLKVLDLRGSKSLRKLPDLSGCKRLEVLILQGCENMTEIHPSIGNLKALKYLDCYFCYALRGLPEDVRSLEELELIIIGGSNQSFNLPVSVCTLKSLKILKLESLRFSKLPQCFGNLTSLVELSLRDTYSVTELPDTIGGLVNLERLTLSRCSQLKNLPDSVQNLKSLVELDVDGSGVRNMPDCFGLSGLRRLSFSASNIPISLGHMTSLVQLKLNGAQVTELPVFIENLKLLKELNIGHSRIRKLPSSIGKLKQLESIHADYSGLSEIPTEIGELSCLLRLDLRGTLISGLPSEISHLPSLRDLSLYNCNELLQQLPQLPSSLQSLDITSKSLKELPDLSNCTNLTILTLVGGQPVSQLECLSLDWIRRCSKLQSLTLRISKLICLPSEMHAIYLNLNCPGLQQIPKVIGLRTLELHQSPVCSKPISFLDEETMESLTLLCVSGCHSSEELDRFSKLQALECFRWSCDKPGGSDFMFLTEWKFLKQFIIARCDSLENLCNLSKLVNLEVLEIFCCNNLKEDKGLGELKSLKKLRIIDCGSLERLTELSKLEKLKDLLIEFCPELREGISPCTLQSLKHYCISDCKRLERLLPDHLKTKGAYRTENHWL